ncbi:MAG: hypothetical protein FWF10_01735 [Clostridiales bacterium]|nr:hypothetical protein [Clostridiales bacterium]
MLFKKNSPPPEATEENPFAELAVELAQMAEEGSLPEGFDLEAACQDPAFAALLGELEPYAAIRIYAAEARAAAAEENAMQTLSARQQARASLPLPARGGSGTTATPDYAAMSPAAFRALEAQLRAAQRRGRK